MNRLLGAWSVQSDGLGYHTKSLVSLLGICHGYVLKFLLRSATCANWEELALSGELDLSVLISLLPVKHIEHNKNILETTLYCGVACCETTAIQMGL